jgi:hypothetical protein
MSDGFSDPDPANPLDKPHGDAPPDDEDDSVDYSDNGTVAAGDVNCQNCAHKAVCTIFEGIAPQLVEYSDREAMDADGPRQQAQQPQQPDPSEIDGEISPVDPRQLAVICDEFLHNDDVP